MVFSSIQYASTSNQMVLDESEKRTEALTLIVGNCRHPGGVKPAVAKIVEQEQADFSHESSFSSKVLSVDICPLMESLTYPHLTIDFAGASSDTILSRLEGIQPNRIFFEWFPSCISGTPGQNASPLLLPALNNAFQIIARDGELIIDHFPYAFSLPSASSAALEKLSVNNTELFPRVSLTIEKHGLSEREGVVSALLQKHDPFTLHICRGEHEELRNYLIFRIKNNKETTFEDSKCKFIKNKTKIIDGLVAQFAENLSMPQTELMIRISNGMLYSYQSTKEDKQGHWDLFEQHYYMKTRSSLITSKLQEIGFSDIEIKYYPVNPYNKRKHAWLITAKKK